MKLRKLSFNFVLAIMLKRTLVEVGGREGGKGCACVCVWEERGVHECGGREGCAGEGYVCRVEAVKVCVKCVNIVAVLSCGHP